MVSAKNWIRGEVVGVKMSVFLFFSNRRGLLGVFVNQFLNLNIDNFTRSNYLDRGYLYCSHHQPGHGGCRSSGDHGVT